MRKISFLIVVILTLLLLMAITVLCQGCGRREAQPTIRVCSGQWQSIWVNNALVKFIIEEGYGYPLEIIETTSKTMLTSIQNGEIDLNMEVWQQNYIDWYNEQIKKGNIVNLGMTLEAGPQFFMIPEWMAEQYHIKTVFDMKDHWELFNDPEDPTKGVFHNGIIGWGATDINMVKLEAYGLTEYYNVVTPHSAKALKAVFMRAQENRKPVFGYYWAPSALIGLYDWYVLEEPPYAEECWKKVIAAKKDERLRPVERACAYEAIPIDKIAHRGLLKKAPDVVTMLKKMNVGLAPLNETLGWMERNKVQDMGKAAIHYLENYEERWKSWVTPSACERIKKAIERERKL